jgi:hypothetical protein
MVGVVTHVPTTLCGRPGLASPTPSPPFAALFSLAIRSGAKRRRSGSRSASRSSPAGMRVGPRTVSSSTAVVRVGATLTPFAPECVPARRVRFLFGPSAWRLAVVERLDLVDERDHGVAPLCRSHGCFGPILCANRDRPALVTDREIDTTVAAHHAGRELTANVKDRETTVGKQLCRLRRTPRGCGRGSASAAKRARRRSP